MTGDQARTEIDLRINAALDLLAYGVLGWLPLEDAAHGAILHLQRVEILMRVDAA